MRTAAEEAGAKAKHGGVVKIPAKGGKKTAPVTPPVVKKTPAPAVKKPIARKIAAKRTGRC